MYRVLSEVTHSVGRLVADVGHNRNKHMLLNGERTGVDGDTEDLNIGDDASPKATNGIREQLGNNLEDGEVKRARSGTSASAIPLLPHIPQ